MKWLIAGAGKQYGLVIDLGKAAGRGITRVKIQADANDTYVVAISTDAFDWSILYIANPVSSGTGLQIRDSGDTLRDFNGKPWVGRYIWVYPSSGDGKYSVSEVQIFNDRKAKKKIDSFGLRMLIRIAETITRLADRRPTSWSTSSAPCSLSALQAM